jgi:hypothetical protein
VTAKGHAPKLAKNVVAVASSEAGNKNVAVALADRKAGCAVGMGRTPAHGRSTVPGTPERGDEINQVLGRPSGDESHDLLLSLTWPPSPFCGSGLSESLRSVRFERITD